MRKWVLLLTLAYLPAYAGESPPGGAKSELAMGEGVSITVYNQDFAVVKERRQMELEAGRQTIEFKNIAQHIDPTSVRFASLTDPDGTRVIEQNFEFDLVSADKLLGKYIDKKIGVITRDGTVIEGFLMSYDGAQIVLAADAEGNGLQIIPRANNITDVRFPSLPEGLLTKPTLVWIVAAGKPGKHLAKVSYITSKVKWHAEYTAVAGDNDTSLDLSGWVSVDNRSGTTYPDAGVKLMAGDVHRVRERHRPQRRLTEGVALAKGAAPRNGFEEKSLAEYHLYTLGRTSTIADRQIKQIELLKASAVPVTKVYTYSGGRDVSVKLRFKNDEESHMGMPLPKGNVRVYKRDVDGELEMITTDSIDHTPKDEKVDITIGSTTQIVGERKKLAQRRPSRRSSEEDYRIRIRNHKDTAVTVNVEEPLNRANWKILRKNMDFEKIDYRNIRFELPVPANSEKVVTYTVRYDW